MTLAPRFQRAWLRTEFSLDGQVAEAGAVLWLQGPTVFVDVRGPGGPGGDNAFAGTVTYRSGIMTWRHRLDRHDDRRVDTARVDFDGEALVEVGADLFGAHTYCERWEPVDAPGAEVEERVEDRLIAVRRGHFAAAVLDDGPDGGFAACCWRLEQGRWVTMIEVGDVGLLPAPDEGLFPLAPESDLRPLIDRLRDAVVLGRYPPGCRLTEDQLAADFGVSRSPIREVLQALSIEGFLRTGRYAGTFVAELSEDEVEDLLELRHAIESLVARRAAERRTPAQLAALRETIDAAFLALQAGRYDVLVELNGRFHTGLAAASGNPTLQRLLEQLRAKIAWVYGADVRVRASESWVEHRAILEAVAGGDADAAAAIALSHVSNAGSAYRRRSTEVVRQ